MTQQEAVDFVERSARRAERNLQELGATLEQLRDADDETAAAIMTGEASRALKFHEEEIASHQARSGATSLARIETHLNHEDSPQARQNYNSLSDALTEGLTPNSKSNMEARLRAMGAIPALGGVMRSHPSAGRSCLQATNSPAARELSRRHSSSGRDGGQTDFNGATSRSPPREPANPPWQGEVRLRHLNSVPNRAAVPQMDHVNDELNAMFAKRQALK